ncbi:BTB/POZ domain-containing protein KCTD19-like [Lytechinus variegatus]|uniref:BTB/POZ domain-containing protein KCTD19-like n=1 Tax=Lytechinus variegatus TaxID=7654 RepID=UPI001BB28AEE|nr:BTB/POZ domain-containing protein KCTD19-like [Lytechinus variegatus]
MSNYIGLNVGGKIYRTSRTTLTSIPRSFFSLMLDESIPSAKDEYGNYLIDRDGNIFRHILNFLRCKKLILPEGFNEFRLLACEADFFQLGTLKEEALSVIGSSEILGLNVGGKVYQTTKETLMREPNGYLATIISEKNLYKSRDKDGNFGIDRDGKLFRYVLNFLREGALILPKTWNEFNLLVNEASFFQIPAICEHLNSLRYFGENNHQAICFFHFYSWHGNYVAYTSQYKRRLEGLFSFRLKSCKYIESVFGVHVLSFTLDDSLAGESLEWFYPNSSGHKCRKCLTYPGKEQDIISMLQIARYSIHRSINLNEESTKYEVTSAPEETSM